jgi:hypothetical protein
MYRMASDEEIYAKYQRRLKVIQEGTTLCEDFCTFIASQPDYTVKSIANAMMVYLDDYITVHKLGYYSVSITQRETDELLRVVIRTLQTIKYGTYSTSIPSIVQYIIQKACDSEDAHTVLFGMFRACLPT